METGAAATAQRSPRRHRPRVFTANRPANHNTHTSNMTNGPTDNTETPASANRPAKSDSAANINVSTANKNRAINKSDNPVNSNDRPVSKNYRVSSANDRPANFGGAGSSESRTASATATTGGNSNNRAASTNKQTNTNKTGKANKTENTKNKVHVSGFPPYTQEPDLLRTFCRFGSVRVDKINARMNYAVLEFQTHDEALAAIQASKKVNIYGEFLAVRQYTPRDHKPQAPKMEFPMTKLKGTIVEPKDIDLSGDFAQQLDSVLERVRLTQEEARAVSKLYEDLERVLQPLWPGCVTMPFGSITTGLGIKTSDADCFVLVPALYRSLHHTFVPRAKKALQAYPSTFAEILSIPRANTPIVKFFHVPTATNCDLSFKTPLGARNSRLIAHLLALDPRLTPLAVALKYWAKVHNLSGTGKLTNYALTMMVIFYVQQPPLDILPSVEWLQRDPADEALVDHWNTGFTTRTDTVPPCADTSSVAELLGGFFEYYANFDFEKLVVCPYLGAPVKRDCFTDLSQLPAQFGRYRANVGTRLTPPLRTSTALCVQDPFEQSHNVASGVSFKLAAEIRAFLEFAADAYDADKLAGSPDLLRTILLRRPKLPGRAKTRPEFRVNIFPRMLAGVAEPDWRGVLRRVTRTAFDTILKIELAEQEARHVERDSKNGKKERDRYVGTITKAIWKRKQFSRLYDLVDMDFVTRQRRITEEILNVEKTAYDLKFVLTVTFNVKPPRSAVLGTKLLDGDADAFKEFGVFFISMMHGWYTQLLRPYCGAAPPDPPADDPPADAPPADDPPPADADSDASDDDDDSDEYADAEPPAPAL